MFIVHACGPDMTRLIEISLPAGAAPAWTKAMEAAIVDMDVEIAPPGTPPQQIDYLVYNIDSGLTDFSAYTRLRAILNTWAGVEAVVATLKWPDHIPFCRMVEPGLTLGMTDYLVAHTMRYHIGIDRAIDQSASGDWEKWLPPLAQERTVGILGLGALGQAAAAALSGLGFPLVGWSRSPRTVPGVESFSGPEGLRPVLERSEILLVILPLTPETECVLNTETLGWLPRGSFIINSGRGPLIDDDALLAALGTGQIAHATLDVFRTEPLPDDHPYWRHRQVTVTPHIAAETRPATATREIAAQIARDMAGQPLLHVVEPSRGY